MGNTNMTHLLFILCQFKYNLLILINFIIFTQLKKNWFNYSKRERKIGLEIRTTKICSWLFTS